MKKTYKIEVDCANCANKLQQEAAKLDGVLEVAVNFMGQKLSVDFAPDADETAVLKALRKTGKRIDDDFELYY